MSEADGEWIGFHADGKLKKISVRDGAAVTLCDAPGIRDLANALGLSRDGPVHALGWLGSVCRPESSMERCPLGPLLALARTLTVVDPSLTQRGIFRFGLGLL